MSVCCETDGVAIVEGGTAKGRRSSGKAAERRAGPEVKLIHTDVKFTACWFSDMSSSHSNGLGLGDAPRSRGAPNGGASSKTLIPTNSVTTKDGGVVKVRIDPTLMVADVVKQLVANLQIKQPPSNFALRDDDDELVTNENLRKMIRSKAKLKYVVKVPEFDPCSIPFRLVNSAGVEAQEIYDKLLLREEKSYRLALFSLQRYLRVGYYDLIIPVQHP
jgi:engulfment/cell motility protein 1